MRRSLPGSLAIRAAARIFHSYTRSTARDFARATEDPVAAQDAVLRRLVTATAKTSYGQRYGIDAGSDYGDWSRKLPVVCWDDLQQWLGTERDTPGTLVPDSVVRWARSAGRTGTPKHVPYTSQLKSSFARAVYVWIHDLLSAGLKLRTGYAFLNVDPPSARSDDRISDEGEYLTGPLAALVRQFLVVDPRIRELRTSDGFQVVLALSLLAAADLEVITIWDPDELVALCDYILTNRERLAGLLEDRRVTVEDHVFRFQPLSSSRQAALTAGDLVALWPALKLVSTCATAEAATGAAELARRLPHALHQGKGLLTTEAPLTIPLAAAGGFIPVVNEVFFELASDDGSICRLHEARIGHEYALVISQAGGLVRYRIGDRIRVTHYWSRMPCLEYVGQAQSRAGSGRGYQ